MFLHSFLLFAIISDCCFSSTAMTYNSLGGKHLRIIWPRWSGNPKGLWGPLKGGVVLDVLTARFNFTYEMVRITENRLEPQGNERGLFSYLWDKQCDFLLQDVLPAFYRNKIDLTTPWLFGNYDFLIPVNDDTANINAVIKPFQWRVWLGLGVSIVCVIAVLILILRFSSHLPSIWNSQVQTNERLTKKQSGKQYLYVVGNLLSQGGPCTSKRLAFRLVAGVWCLAAFIFVQAYTSTLYTYVITPVNQPLINSAYDIVERNDIQLFAITGTPLEVLVSDPNATDILKKFGNKLNSIPGSRCKSKPECISTITPGSRNVYIDAVNYLKDTIKEDFHKTKKCRLQIANIRFMPTFSSFALQKNSPYTKSVSLGILELQQSGLIDFWDTWFRPMPPQCNGKTQTKTPGNNRLSSLSFKNLTGSFLLLVVGLSLSLLVFLVEQMNRFR